MALMRIQGRWHHRRVWLLLGVLLSVLFLSGCDHQEHQQVVSHQGETLSLVAKDDTWLVINYWAIWCAPCRKEIPELNQLHKADNGIRVWGVDFDQPANLAILAERIATLAIDFPVVRSADVPKLDLAMPPVLPATYLLAPDGQVMERLLGPQTKESIEAAIGQFTNL